MREGSVIEYVRACVPPRIIWASSSFKRDLQRFDRQTLRLRETDLRFIADCEIDRWRYLGTMRFGGVNFYLS